MTKSRRFAHIFLTSALIGIACDANAATVGSISGNLQSGADILVKLMWAACVVVGIGLVAASFTQFQIHRNNPKLVPLTTPVMYIILGVLALSIPFGERILGYLDAYVKEDQRYDRPADGQPYRSTNIDERGRR